MVVTRSRRSQRLRKLQTDAEKAKAKILEEEEKEETSKTKKRKVLKPKAYKKVKKKVIPPKQVIEKESTPKAKSPAVSDNESKKQKIPAYKIQQLERLQRLMDMSSVAKPRGPITTAHFNKKLMERNGNELRLSLDKENKYKISNVTNYDPVRQRFINGELTEKEINELSEKYVKIRKYKNIKVPQLADDVYLKEALSEIVEKNQSIKFWDYYNFRTNYDPSGDHVLLENEKKLNTLVEFEEKQVEDEIKEILAIPFDDRTYEKIDMTKVEATFNLDTMLHGVNAETIVEEGDTIFNGLKEEDYKVLKDYKSL